MRTDALIISSSVIAAGPDPRYPVPRDNTGGGTAVKVAGYSANISRCRIGVDITGHSAIQTQVPPVCNFLDVILRC